MDVPDIFRDWAPHVTEADREPHVIIIMHADGREARNGVVPKFYANNFCEAFNEGMCVSVSLDEGNDGRVYCRRPDGARAYHRPATVEEAARTTRDTAVVFDWLCLQPMYAIVERHPVGGVFVRSICPTPLEAKAALMNAHSGDWDGKSTTEIVPIEWNIPGMRSMTELVGKQREET